jgi:DNA-binding response OmpR family regulator
MRVLYISTTHRTGGWLAEALAIDSATKIVLEEAVGSMAGLARLREDVFDAVLVSHQPGELDALELIEGYRTGVADAPIVVMGTESEQEMTAVCYELGADAYVCVNTTTTRNLIWVLARAIERHTLLRETQRLSQAHQRRLQQEHDEASRLLNQQRSLVNDLETDQSDPPADEFAAQIAAKHGVRATVVVHGRPPALPDELIVHYRELLRTYVIMGAGNLSAEMRRLAELLTVAGISAKETMQLHLYALEELVQGLGARSTRHVMTRADLLALEIMMYLAEGYRTLYRQRTHPDVQRMLPGFEQAASTAF